MDHQIYALKKVIMTKLKQKEKENSLNEIRILASINHQNIISYKDAFYDSELNALCIVTEFADDGDLEKKINDHIKKKTQFSETQIFSIFIQILNGLKALHDQKIMHRDIKAANMLLFKDGFVKIGDMNVSKVIKNGLMNTQTGTPYYASPEVWNNKSYDCKSDIWSLGCLLYEMTTLKAPFRGTSMKNLFEKVMKGTYDPISGFYSKNLSEIIKSMLMLNPQLRPNCDAILRTICRKITNLSYNFPLEYEANANGQNYYKNFKNEMNGKNEIEANTVTKINNNNFYLINNQNNKQNHNKEIINEDNTNEEKKQKELLDTIKIPKKLNEINGMLPKSNYRKKIFSTSVNYDSHVIRNNDLSLPGILNKSSNENHIELDISKDIIIKNNTPKILNDLKINYRPISYENKSINHQNYSSINNLQNQNNNDLSFNKPNQNINNANNLNTNNFNKRNITNVNNPLKNIVNNKNPIIVNQISSKIDKINIVNYNVDLLEKLANMNNIGNNNLDSIVLTTNDEQQKLIENNNNCGENSHNDKHFLNKEEIYNNSSNIIPITNSIKNNIGNFYMRKNMDKITSLKIQTNEEPDKNILSKKLNNISNIDKNRINIEERNANENLQNEHNVNISQKMPSKKVLEPINLNIDINTKLRRVPAKNLDLASLEEVQNTIRQSQNEINMILNQNFLNEYIPFNIQSTKNKSRHNLFANRNFIVSEEKNHNKEKFIIKNGLEDENVYLKTDVDNYVNSYKNDSSLNTRKKVNDTPNNKKFNNIKIDLEINTKNNLVNKHVNNQVESINNQNNTDFEQKSNMSNDKEIEENIISSKNFNN